MRSQSQVSFAACSGLGLSSVDGDGDGDGDGDKGGGAGRADRGGVEGEGWSGEGVEEEGGGEAGSGLGGRRLAFCRTLSGGMVSLPFLKTYFAMPVANRAGFGSGFLESPFAVICSLVEPSFSLLSPLALAFRHGCKTYPLGLTLPVFTKWLMTYSHF